MKSISTKAINYISNKFMHNSAWIFISGFLFLFLGNLTSAIGIANFFYLLMIISWMSILFYSFFSKDLKEFLDKKLLKTLRLLFLMGLLGFIFYIIQSDLVLNKFIYDSEWEAHKSLLKKLKTFFQISYLILLSLTLLFSVLFQTSLSAIRQDNQIVSALKTMTINIGLFFSLLIVINFVSNLRPFTIDMTTVGIYSLSEQSKNLLSKVNKKVQVTAFYPYFHDLHKTIKLLLSDVESNNNNIKVKFADAIREKDLADQKKVSHNGLIVFESIDPSETEIDKRIKRRVVSINKTKALKKAEREIMSAILAVTQKKRKIYFTTGHREFLSIGSSIDNSNLISFYQEELRKQNYDVKEITFDKEDMIPQDADAIAIIGAKNTFSKKEQEVLQKYLYSGGRILLALDPDFRADFSFLLKDFRVEYFHKKVYSEVATKQNKSDIGTNNFTKNHITEYLLDVYGSKFFMRFPGTGYFVLNRQMKTYKKDFTVDFFIKSNYRSWIEKKHNGIRDIKLEKYKAKNLALLIKQKDILLKDQKKYKARSKKQKEMSSLKMIVFGDSHIFSNLNIGNLSNEPVVINSMKWLLENKKLMGILPKKVSSSKVSLSIIKDKIVFYFLVFLWPIFIFLLGKFGGKLYFRKKST